MKREFWALGSVSVLFVLMTANEIIVDDGVRCVVIGAGMVLVLIMVTRL